MKKRRVCTVAQCVCVCVFETTVAILTGSGSTDLSSGWPCQTVEQDNANSLLSDEVRLANRRKTKGPSVKLDRRFFARRSSSVSTGGTLM